MGREILESWRKQPSWQHETDVSRRVLHVILRTNLNPTHILTVFLCLHPHSHTIEHHHLVPLRLLELEHSLPSAGYLEVNYQTDSPGKPTASWLSGH